MSESSDRPYGHRPMPPPQPPPMRAAFEEYSRPLTGPPPSLESEPIFPSLGGPPSDERPAEHGSERRKKAAEPGAASIVPAGSVTGRSLTLVVTIMCFLACLTAGAVYMVHQSADAWLRDIASEITIQIEPQPKGDTERMVRDVTTYLAGLPGVRSVKPLSLEAATELVEPWLGKSEALKALPVPRLIALELDRGNAPDLERLRQTLGKQFKGVTLDDHRRWQSQIRAVTRSMALGGLAILCLVGAATMAIIVSATRSAMASNREIVEVLHFVGATDRFIAREFETQFLRLGIRAGLVGAVSAMFVFFMMPWVMELLGGGGVSMAELHRLVGAGTLDAMGYLVLVLVVLMIAAACMFTSRVSVYRILHSQQ